MVDRQRKEIGFTLLELLIVVGIIAILAAAAVIALNPQRQFAAARNSQRWNDVSALSSSVYSYVAATGGYWPNCLLSPGGTTEASNCASDLVPDFITGIPVDPQVTTGPNTTGYLLNITANNRLDVWVDDNNPEITDPGAKDIEIIR